MICLTKHTISKAALFLLVASLLACNKNNTSAPETETPEKTETRTIETGTFTDSRDGKMYQTVKIGNQVWMAENLAYASDKSTFYNRDSSMLKQYGRLYEFGEACRVCPEGWHLPTESEWDQLIAYLGNDSLKVGGMLKSETLWQKNRDGQNDPYGFSALPAGYYNVHPGDFHVEKLSCSFWGIPDNNHERGFYVSIYYDNDEIVRNNPYKDFGLSVRCVKDSLN